MRKLGAVLLASAVMFAAGCAGDAKRVKIENFPSRPPTVTIEGNVTVPADAVASQDFEGGDCVGADGYEDISAGAQVRVTTSKGVVVKVGALNGGHTSALFADDGTIIAGKASECSYHFHIEGVSGELDMYGVSIGNTFRGTNYFAPGELKAIQIGLVG